MLAEKERGRVHHNQDKEGTVRFLIELSKVDIAFNIIIWYTVRKWA